MIIKKDIVLVNLREYQDTVCDLLMKYNAEDVQNLVIYKEIPEHLIGYGNFL